MPEFEQLAKNVAHEAGAVMLRHFGLSVAHTFKADRSPLTRADREINDLVLKRIGEAYPEHSLIGEEGSRITGSEFSWIFDPVDGTQNFLRGVPVNVFSIALAKDGKPILGVVYDPHQKRLYRATKGGGAYLNDEPIRTASHTELAGSFIEADGLREFKDMNFIETLTKEKARFLSYGSTTYAQMLVASGQIDAAIFPLPGRPWDSAAAKIIVEEAGGIVTDLQGKEQRYDMNIGGTVSAGNRELHERLLRVVAGSL
ncbi:MAG: inositol monophosphatase [bacterium]